MASISLLSRTLRMSVSVLGRLPAISSTLAMALGNNRSSMSHNTATLTLGSLAKLTAWSLPRERIPMTATLTVSLGLALARLVLRSGAAAIKPAAPLPACLTNLRRVIDPMVHTPFNGNSRERAYFTPCCPELNRNGRRARRSRMGKIVREPAHPALKHGANETERSCTSQKLILTLSRPVVVVCSRPPHRVEPVPHPLLDTGGVGTPHG